VSVVFRITNDVQNPGTRFLDLPIRILFGLRFVISMPANKKPKSFEHWTLLKPKDTDPVTKYVWVLLPCIELISKDQYMCNFCNKVLAEKVTHTL
jgi:hypothetical protein